MSTGSSNNTKRALLIVGGLLLLGLVFAGFSVFMLQQQAKFDAEGVEVQAEIVDLDRRVRAGDRKDDYYLTYQFTVGEQTFQSRKNITRQAYFRYQDGDPINIIYLQSDPNVSQIASEGNAAMPMIFMVGSVVWIVLALVGGGIFIARSMSAQKQPAMTAEVGVD